MSRALAIACSVSLLAVLTIGLVPVVGNSPRADAASDWLGRYDEIAAQFSGTMIVDGEAYPLEGPRRMAHYRPQTNDRNAVFAGAVYALHVSGNPEVIIAIEDSGNPADPITHIEVSRLSGAAMVVSRNNQEVARFPRTGEVVGAYYGLADQSARQG